MGGAAADAGVVDITPAGFDLAWPGDISPKGYIAGIVQLVNDVNGCGTILGRGKVAGTGEPRAIIWARRYTCDIGPGSTGP